MLQNENARLRKQSSPEPSISSVNQDQGFVEVVEPEFRDKKTSLEERAAGRERVIEVERGSNVVAERLSIVESKLDSMVTVKERTEEQEALRSMIKVV